MNWITNQTNYFKRAYKKLPQNIQEKFKKIFPILLENPFHPKLRTHKLQGELNPCYASSITFEYRVVFYCK